MGKLPLTFHPSNSWSKNCKWSTGKVNQPSPSAGCSPKFLGSDVYIAQGQIKKGDFVQGEQILRQPVRLKPPCDGSVLLVKLVLQEGKENQAQHHRISFGKQMKLFMLPALHSQLWHWNCLHKAGLKKKNTVIVQVKKININMCLNQKIHLEIFESQGCLHLLPHFLPQ